MACSKHSMEAPVGQVVGGKPGGRGKGQSMQGCGGPGEQLGFYSKWNGRPCWILSSGVKDRKRRHRVDVSSFQKSQTGEVEDQAYSRSQCPAVLPLPKRWVAKEMRPGEFGEPPTQMGPSFYVEVLDISSLNSPFSPSRGLFNQWRLEG